MVIVQYNTLVWVPSIWKKPLWTSLVVINSICHTKSLGDNDADAHNFPTHNNGLHQYWCIMGWNALVWAHSRWSYKSIKTSPIMIKVECHIGFFEDNSVQCTLYPSINLSCIVSKLMHVQWNAPCLFHSTWKKPLWITMTRVNIVWAVLHFLRTRVFVTQSIWHLRFIL